MILYHGTNTDIAKIDLSLCAPYKDFGTGFYTTTLFDQAKAMAVRKSKLFGGKPCVISYEAPDNLLELKAVKIINNRNRDFTDISSPECNLDNK